MLSPGLTRFLLVVGILVTLVLGCVVGFIEIAGRQRPGESFWVYRHSAVFTQDNQRFYSLVHRDTLGEATKQLRAWETKTGKLLWQAPVDKPDESRDGFNITIAVSPNYVAVLRTRSVSVHSAATGKVLWAHPLHRDGLEPWLAFSPDEKTLVYSLGESVVAVAPTTGAPLWEGGYSGKGGFLPDGTLLLPERRGASGSSKATSIVVVDPQTGERKRTVLPEPSDWCLSPSGRLLACVSPKALWLVDTASGKVLQRIAYTHPFQGMSGSMGIGPGIPAITFNSKETKVYPYGPDFWDLKTNTVQDHTLDGEHWGEITSPDGTLMLEKGQRGGLHRRFPLGYLVDTASEKRVVTLEGQTGW